MGHDCYCAVCGSTLHGYQVAESGDEDKSQLRREYVLHGLRERARRRGIGADQPMDPETSRKHKYPPYGINYDSAIMEGHDDAWLSTLVFLAYEPNVRSLNKCWITGQGRHEDYNWGHLLGDSPIGHPEVDEYQLELYQSHKVNGIPSYPIHNTCLQLLSRAIIGDEDFSKLDADVLYEVMRHDLGHDASSCLNVEYGDFRGREQFWDSNPGEEFAVINPLETLNLRPNTFVQRVPANTTSLFITGVESQTSSDPFSALPLELLEAILKYVDGPDIFALRRASKMGFNMTQNQSFWKAAFFRDMRWLWELVPCESKPRNLLTSEPDNVDWLRTYLFLDHHTAYPWGMSGDFMALANRRRIWRVCERMATLYESHMPERSLCLGPLAKSGITLQVPEVSHPSIRGKTTAFATALTSWDEREAASNKIISAWNGQSELVGISFQKPHQAFASSRLITTVLSPGDWIAGIHLFIPAVNVPEAVPTAITGFQLSLSSGKLLSVGDTDDAHDQRMLSPSHGRELVGLLQRIDEACREPRHSPDYRTDRAISRRRLSTIGLIETYRCDELNSDRSPAEVKMPYAKQWLWAGSSVNLPDINSKDDRPFPIWDHPSLYMKPFAALTFDEAWGDELTKTLIPMQTLLFSPSAAEGRQLTSIQVLQVPGGTITDGRGNEVQKTWKIISIRARYGDDTFRPLSIVGYPPCTRVVATRAPERHGWLPEHVSSIQIDGQSGELIEEIAAEISQGLKAIRIKTSLGQEKIFGSPSGNNTWHGQRAAKNKTIVGFVCGFGTPQGLKSESGYMSRQWGQRASLTCITALTAQL